MISNLLICPNCKKEGKQQVLGRVMENGEFLVLRFHHGTTIIQSTNYTVVCGCGYRFEVNNGTAIIQT